MLAARTSFSSSPRSHSLSLSTSTTPDSMMAFNPAAAAFSQAQLLAAQQQPMTPMKPDSDAASDALRYLSNGGLLGAQFPFPGMPANFEAMRSMLPQGLPLPLMYPQLQQKKFDDLNYLHEMYRQDFKPEMFSAGGGPFPGMVFDPSVMGFHPYAGLDGARRKNATRETTAPLKEWLNQHRKNPYPNKGEKVMLAVMTKMTLTQVSTWFANARRRLKKENKWSPPSKGDEDDLADIDTIDRPSSSNSNLSDAKDDVDISIDTNENLKTPLGGDVTPKKKIWSIADTIEVKTESRNNENDEAGSSKKDSPSSDDCSPPMSFQQQMMAMCARLPGFNTQLLAACQQPAAATPVAAKNTAFFPFNPLLMAFNQQQQQQQNTLSGSFSSDAASVSPSSSHSASDSKPHLGSPQNSPSPSSPQ